MISSESPFSNFRALIIDDHPVNILFAKKLIKKLGFKHVETAHNGRVGVEAFQTDSYDIILMDCQMPEMDGFEATQAIRQIERERNTSKRTPIIALTADAIKGAKEQCLEVGMDHYMSKPIDQDGIVKALDQFLSTDTYEESKPQHASTNDNHIENSDDLPVDMEHFKLFTDDDPEEEQALLNLFFEQAALSIDELHNAAQNDNSDEWKKAAHKLKGSAANLGAIPLSHICHKAETEHNMHINEKETCLQSIKQELTRVKMFMRRVIRQAISKVDMRA